MDVVVAPPDELALIAADAVTALVARRPDAVLGLATGSTPLGLYDELARRVADGRLSLARAHAFLLDEYLGLPAGHPESYGEVICRELVDRVDLVRERVHVPDAHADDVDAACARYEAAIVAAGGIDLQILGVGTNGHIAFNERGCALDSRTHVESLTAQTRVDNSRFFGDDVDAVPTRALTQGLGTILDSRHAVLLATGERKAEAVAELVDGSMNRDWPVTALRQHPNVTVLIDDAAASRLRDADRYRAGLLR